MAAWQKVLSGLADPLDLFGGRASYDAREAERKAKDAREQAQQVADQLYRDIPGDRSRSRDAYVADREREWREKYGGRDIPDFKRDQWRAEAQERFPDTEAPEEEVTEDMLLGESETAESAREYEDEFRDIYDQGGMDAITRAENAQARREYNQQARAQRQAALQNMYSRGMGGSGAQMASQLQSGQSAADASYQARLGNLAEGRQRALQSLQQAGRYGTAAGGAADAFNQANTQYRQGVQQRNVGREYDDRWQQHRAREEASAQKQGLSTRAAGSDMSYARQQQQQAQQQQQQTGGALAGIIGGLVSDEDAKENVRPASSREIEAALEAGRRAGREEASRSSPGWDRVPADDTQQIRNEIVRNNPGITGEELDRRFEQEMRERARQSTPRGVPPWDRADRFLGESRESSGSESGGDEKKPTSSLLDAVRPATYEYKPEHRAEGGSGEQFGVMAQDLERSRLGRTMVEDGEDGVKRVDVRKAALANLAATSDLHERLKRLEGGRNG